MTKTHPDSVSTLQQRAEEIYLQRLQKAAPQSAEIDTTGQIRELQVKLIEQELLNQELIQAIKQTGQDSNRNAPVNPTNDLLSKNDECFKTTLDHMLEGCQIIGFDWRYLYLNRTAEVHNRRAIKELIGNRYMDMWPGIENTEVFKLIRQTLEERIPNRLENEFLFPNGEKGWFDLSIQPVPEGVFILSIDITDRKLNEIRLRESDLRFRKIFEEGPFGMALVNIDFRFSMANARLCEMLGFEETELKRLTFNDITHTDDIASDIRNVKRLIAGEIPVYRTEKRYIRKNGQLIWGSLTVAANYDDNGQFLYNVAIIEDITRRKVAEEQLLASKAKLETAIASMTDAIFISDASGQFIEFNDAFADFHKFRNRDECTRTFADYPNFLEVLFPDGGIVPVDQWAVPRALRGEVAKNAEYRLRRKDTGETWIGSYSFAPIRDGNETIIGAVVAGRDITDRKQAEEALRISEERYRNIFESAVIGIYRTSPEGKILMANSTLIKMLGFDS
ncbi:MAG: PAS domain S-box protein, partial [Prolixibacteraceae bacterium]|nr:PAS domain S-box protein [Prolixibacteraceae bacterium]